MASVTPAPAKAHLAEGTRPDSELTKNLIYLTPDFAVAPALSAEDFAEAARLGFKSIINNRPDGEQDGQRPAAELSSQAQSEGLGYAHVPANKLELFCDDVVDGMIGAMKSAEGPVLAHCQSGMRSAIVWAAATSRNRPVDDVLEILDKAGFELDFLRDELDQQANHADAIGTIPSAASAQPGPISTWDSVRGAIKRQLPKFMTGANEEPDQLAGATEATTVRQTRD